MLVNVDVLNVSIFPCHRKISPFSIAFQHRINRVSLHLFKGYQVVMIHSSKSLKVFFTKTFKYSNQILNGRKPAIGVTECTETIATSEEHGHDGDQKQHDLAVLLYFALPWPSFAPVMIASLDESVFILAYKEVWSEIDCLCFMLKKYFEITTVSAPSSAPVYYSI